MAECTPEMYLDGANTGIDSLTPEAVEAHNVERSARGLSHRAMVEQATAGITDEDTDSGNFDSRQAGAESLLQEAISKASRATDPAERAKWSHESERIAASLVNHNLVERNTETQVKREEPSAFDELRNQSIDIEAAIAFAGDSEMSENSIADWNKQLQSKNKAEAMNAGKLLDDFRQNPQYFITEDYQPIPEALENEIVTEFGEHVGYVLSTTALAISQGIAKPADVFKLYAGDKAVQSAFKTLLKRGTLVMPI